MNNTHFGRTTTISATLVAIMFLGLADIASAQVNDDLLGAELVPSVPFADTVSNIGAGTETFEGAASCGTDGGTYLWWVYTPIVTGPVEVNTEGSGFDSILSVLTGVAHPLSEIACNDDDGGLAGESKLFFNGTSGTTYYLRVVGSTLAVGNVVINVADPNPDDLAWAVVVTSLPFEGTGSKRLCRSGTL